LYVQTYILPTKQNEKMTIGSGKKPACNMLAGQGGLGLRWGQHLWYLWYSKFTHTESNIMVAVGIDYCVRVLRKSTDALAFIISLWRSSAYTLLYQFQTKKDLESQNMQVPLILRATTQWPV
jgi:hypothetical protein